MAPAAYDTLSAHFSALKASPSDYDMIVTGDLGHVGAAILRGLFAKNGVTLGNAYNDCGMMIYDQASQDVHAGGSGCGCSASVLCGELLNGLRAGKWKRLLFAATGALMSPTSSMQGESIPSVCCAVEISTSMG